MNLEKSASIIALTSTLFVILLKFYGWLVTDSVSILASLMDSLLDITVSVINYYAIKYSQMPPDDNHRFGHDKIQDLAVFAQSIFFFFTGIIALFTAFFHYTSEAKIMSHSKGEMVMIISTLVTLILVMYQHYVISKTGSNIIKADKVHYFSDFLANIAVFASIKISKIWPSCDIFFGVLVASYIMYGSYSLFRTSIKRLIDEELDNSEKKIVLNVISRFKEVKGVHELKTRRAGNKVFIQFHMEIDGELSLYDAHQISDMIENQLLKHFKEAEVTIHLDPAGLELNTKYQENV